MCFFLGLKNRNYRFRDLILLDVFGKTWRHIYFQYIKLWAYKKFHARTIKFTGFGPTLKRAIFISTCIEITFLKTWKLPLWEPIVLEVFNRMFLYIYFRNIILRTYKKFRVRTTRITRNRRSLTHIFPLVFRCIKVFSKPSR